MKSEIQNLTSKVVELEQRIEIQNHILGYEIWNSEASENVLLKEIELLLSDAIDFLETEPSKPSGALKRINAVLKMTKNKRNRLSNKRKP